MDKPALDRFDEMAKGLAAKGDKVIASTLRHQYITLKAENAKLKAEIERLKANG